MSFCGFVRTDLDSGSVIQHLFKADSTVIRPGAVGSSKLFNPATYSSNLDRNNREVSRLSDAVRAIRATISETVDPDKLSSLHLEEYCTRQALDRALFARNEGLG